MDERKETLTPAEWQVMECLWAREDRGITGGEAAAQLSQTAGWSRSTTLTMLSRMEKKGIVQCDASGKKLLYRPLLDRTGAVQRETKSFLSRVYQGSLRQMVSFLTEQETLTDEEFDELYALLEQAKEGRKA